MSLKELRDEIERAWPAHPALTTCLLILDQLESVPAHSLRHLTFHNLASFARKPRIDEELVMAVNMLTSSPVNVFDVHFSYIDDLDRESEVEPTEVQEFQRTGVFIDPRTGSVVANADERLLPYFAASGEFLKARASNR